jgi:hypothetical protein
VVATTTTVAEVVKSTDAEVKKNKNKKNGSEPSTGVIAGSVVGAVAFVAIVAFVVRTHTKKSSVHTSSAPGEAVRYGKNEVALDAARNE